MHSFSFADACGLWRYHYENRVYVCYNEYASLHVIFSTLGMEYLNTDFFLFVFFSTFVPFTVRQGIFFQISERYIYNILALTCIRNARPVKTALTVFIVLITEVYSALVDMQP